MFNEYGNVIRGTCLDVFEQQMSRSITEFLKAHPEMTPMEVRATESVLLTSITATISEERLIRQASLRRRNTDGR